jgi:hypothetical protein
MERAPSDLWLRLSALTRRCRVEAFCTSITEGAQERAAWGLVIRRRDDPSQRVEACGTHVHSTAMEAACLAESRGWHRP